MLWFVYGVEPTLESRLPFLGVGITSRLHVIAHMIVLLIKVDILHMIIIFLMAYASLMVFLVILLSIDHIHDLIVH